METGNWYIYEIKNLINGKTYIGQRKCPKNKTPETDIWYMGSGLYLKNAIAKHGIENFEKRIIIQNICTKEKINELEINFIAMFRKKGKAEYNLADGGQNNFTKEAIEKIRLSLFEINAGKEKSFQLKQNRK
jgi:hypothetical protein